MFLQTSGHLLPVVTRHTVPSHPSFAQVAHAVISKLNAKELGCAGALLTAPPRRARGQAQHQCWQREAGGMSSLGHMPCLCLPRAGKAATELSQHPSQHQKRIGLLQLFVLPSTLSKHRRSRSAARCVPSARGHVEVGGGPAGRRETADGGRGPRALLELSPETPPLTGAPSLKEPPPREGPAGTETGRRRIRTRRCRCRTGNRCRAGRRDNEAAGELKF